MKIGDDKFYIWYEDEGTITEISQRREIARLPPPQRRMMMRQQSQRNVRTTTQSPQRMLTKAQSPQKKLKLNNRVLKKGEKNLAKGGQVEKGGP